MSPVKPKSGDFFIYSSNGNLSDDWKCDENRWGHNYTTFIFIKSLTYHDRWIVVKIGIELQSLGNMACKFSRWNIPEIRYSKFLELDIPEIRHPDYPEFQKLGINNFRNLGMYIFRNRSAKFRKLDTLEFPECYHSVPFRSGN